MFGKSSLRVGLDIGTFSVKLVAMDKSGGRFRPVRIVKQDLYPELDSYDPEGPKRSVAVPAVSEALKQAGLVSRKLRNLYSTIGGAQVSAKEIAALHLDDEEMSSAMLLEARKHLPLDGSSTIIDYQILGEHPKEPDKVRVLIAATTKKLVDAHFEILRDLELKPGVLDIDQLAAINSYMTERDFPDEGVLVFLNLGARKTNLTVAGRSDLFFTRDIALAGHAFTEELMKKYGLDYSQAEKIKREQGMNPEIEFSGEGSSSGFKMAEKTTMERLCDEINRSLRYYVKESGQSLFNHMVLTGGTSALKGLSETLQNRFNVSVEVYDPLKTYEFEGDGIYGPQFAVAIGLARRGD